MQKPIRRRWLSISILCLLVLLIAGAVAFTSGMLVPPDRAKAIRDDRGAAL